MTDLELFDGRYPRYTRQIGFFEASVEDVLAFFDAWWMRTDKVHAVPRARPESLESILAGGFSDWLLVRGDPPWTAMFVPELEGGPVRLAAWEAGIRSVYIRDRPGEMLEFTVTERDSQRSVMAYEDGGSWAFHEDGQPFAFEEVEQYRARRKRDRLTSRMVHAYAAGLGIRFADPTFYGGERVSFKHEGIGSALKRIIAQRLARSGN